MIVEYIIISENNIITRIPCKEGVPTFMRRATSRNLENENEVEIEKKMKQKTNDFDVKSSTSYNWLLKLIGYISLNQTIVLSLCKLFSILLNTCLTREYYRT